MRQPLRRAHPALTGGPRCEPYRHAGYLTATGLWVTFLLAATVPAVVVAAAAPGVIAVLALLGVAVGRLGRPGNRA